MMESITKYELVTTLEFQLVTESSLPDWIVRLDLYKTKKNKEVLYYPRIFSRELYMISRHGKRSVSHWLWTQESFRDLCWDAHIRAKDEDHAVQILESYLNHWINNREIPPNVKNCIIDENPLNHG